ncbi:hypothetical protein BDR04DRAFT_1109576 [Suillus decipiens]|nr:hypothetical protein BDR04DRAFT_1109576 [Suillus decipiens]
METVASYCTLLTGFLTTTKTSLMDWIAELFFLLHFLIFRYRVFVLKRLRIAIRGPYGIPVQSSSLDLFVRF